MCVHIYKYINMYCFIVCLAAHELVRLVGGNGPEEGQVEVFYDGVWGTVCSTLWNIQDADVVCKSLNYSRALSYSSYSISSNESLSEQQVCSCVRVWMGGWITIV